MRWAFFHRFYRKTLSIRTKCRSREKIFFFRDFYFYDFRLKRDEVHGMEKVCGWDFKAETSKNLSHLLYS